MALLSWLNTGALLLPLVAFIALHVDALGRQKALGAARVVRAAAPSPPRGELEEGWSLERTAVLPPRPLAEPPARPTLERARFTLDCAPAPRPSADDATNRRDAAPPPAPQSAAAKVFERLLLVAGARRRHR